MSPTHADSTANALSLSGFTWLMASFNYHTCSFTSIHLTSLEEPDSHTCSPTVCARASTAARSHRHASTTRRTCPTGSKSDRHSKTEQATMLDQWHQQFMYPRKHRSRLLSTKASSARIPTISLIRYEMTRSNTNICRNLLSKSLEHHTYEFHSMSASACQSCLCEIVFMFR